MSPRSVLQLPFHTEEDGGLGRLNELSPSKDGEGPGNTYTSPHAVHQDYSMQ